MKTTLPFKLKEKTKKLYLPPFRYTVNIILTDDVFLSRNARVVEIGHTMKDVDRDCISALHAYNHNSPQPESFIVLPFDATNGLVAHECLHCVQRIFKWLGAKKENELSAYYLEYLVDTTWELLASSR